MEQNRLLRVLYAAVLTAIALVAARYLLPVALPFLLGAGLALAAEPAVGLLSGKLRLKRLPASLIGVTVVFTLALTLLVLLVAALARQLGRLSGLLPQLADAAQQGITSARGWALELSEKLPESVGQVAANWTEQFFSDGSALMQEAVSRVPKAATDLIAGLSEGALVIFTTVLSGYMISARLPRLRTWCREKLPQSWQEIYLPALRRIRRSLWGWLLAQGKLMGITFVLLAAGLLILRVDNALLLAAVIALVDAFPVLGTGTVLVPWSLVCLLQRQTARGIGLLGVYLVVWLVRSVLEPRILGKELGLDPLVTLAAIYAGFRLWGIGGMFLAPLAAMAVTQAIKKEP